MQVLIAVNVHKIAFPMLQLFSYRLIMKFAKYLQLCGNGLIFIPQFSCESDNLSVLINFPVNGAGWNKKVFWQFSLSK